MAFVLEKYLQQIRDATSKPGVYAYRGQSRAEWPLHSAATRRLAKSLGHDALNAPGFSKVYIDYHRETLISPARTRGFGVESGRDISDLQLLAKLQHFEAATGLLDFTRSPLIALWFVSRESDSDGKLFVLNVNDPIHVAKVPSDLERQAIDTVFSRADNEPGLLYWEPMWSGDAMPRILRQRGIFIIGRPLIPTDGQFIEAIKVSKNDKAFLLDELALLDISDSSMVADVYGFSSLEGATASTHVSTPQFNLIQGNQHYQAGNYIQAIVAYDNCIDLSPGVGELHLLRGNAKSEAILHREAVHDYRQAIALKDRPFLGLRPMKNNVMVDLILFMAHFNCGNALAELSDYDAALSSYNTALLVDRIEVAGKDQAYFNRGNVYLDLGQFEQAICDYDTAMSLRTDGVISPGLLFNKGNALVAVGQFKQALECYRLAEDENVRTNGAAQNRETLERIRNALGAREYHCYFVKDPDAPVDRLVVQVAGSVHERVMQVVQGRVGNTGNFGWHGVSGKGFSGSHGFVVEIVGTQQDGASTIAPHES